MGVGRCLVNLNLKLLTTMKKKIVFGLLILAIISFSIITMEKLFAAAHCVATAKCAGGGTVSCVGTTNCVAGNGWVSCDFGSATASCTPL